MLKGFSLHNILKGLTNVLRKVTSSHFITSTIVLDQESGELIRETVNSFDFELLSDKGHVTLFTIGVENGGTIILDLF
jgi:hypothetical protein